jgi:hypothetical protein
MSPPVRVDWIAGAFGMKRNWYLLGLLSALLALMSVFTAIAWYALHH